MRGHFFAEHGGVSDTDWVRVALTAGTRYRFTLTLHGVSATAGATIVGVYNSSGTKVADGATAPPDKHCGPIVVHAQRQRRLLRRCCVCPSQVG